MYHTISNIDKTIDLQQYIDNRDGNKCVGLKSFTYTLGWYNLENATVQVSGGLLQRLPSGYYSFQQLADKLLRYGITTRVNETNGISTITSRQDVKISTQLKDVLGINKKSLSGGDVYVGVKPVDFAIYKTLYVHLEQLNTSDNYLNGNPSTVLATIPVEKREFGDIVNVQFPHPIYKCLKAGTINELKLELRDESNNKIKNNLSINCVLEIR